MDAKERKEGSKEAELTGSETQTEHPVQNESRWYAIKVQSGFEDKVEALLNSFRVGEGPVSEVVVPKQKVTEVKGGKREVIEKKIYPGYVFVNMRLTDEMWYKIRSTKGVGNFVGLGKPMPLSQGDVNKIFKLIEKSDKEPALNVTFQKGDTVRVKDGPFESFEGTVEELNIKKGTVKVSMVVFGRPTAVELDYWQLEKV